MFPLLLALSLFSYINHSLGYLFLPTENDVVYQNYSNQPINPLILTPLIQEGKIKEAQAAASVHFEDFKNVTSYSGFLTVNEKYNSNLFFWYFPSASNQESAPVLVWLQGGPGVSSMFGLFCENGPFIVNKDLSVELREHSWSKNHHVIYIDNPVGTGFSFGNPDGYASNEDDVGRDLFEFLQQFFTLFPNLQKNDFFVSGESYAGKYVPAISYYIHKNNLKAKVKINLKGLAIGDGLSDPINQMNFADFAYELGFVDDKGREHLKKLEKEGRELIHQKKYGDALSCFNNLLKFDYLAGDLDIYKFTELESDPSTVFYAKYLNNKNVQTAIHVGRIEYHEANIIVHNNLSDDMMHSVALWISELLSFYKVMTYNGQLDIICGYFGTNNYLRHLKFSGKDQFTSTNRIIWTVSGDIAGYAKQGGNLTQVLVRNAGHMVPSDQPEWASDLITRFTHNKPFD